MSAKIVGFIGSVTLALTFSQSVRSELANRRCSVPIKPNLESTLSGTAPFIAFFGGLLDQKNEHVKGFWRQVRNDSNYTSMPRIQIKYYPNDHKAQAYLDIFAHVSAHRDHYQTPVVLVGHSWGGDSAWEVASDLGAKESGGGLFKPHKVSYRTKDTAPVSLLVTIDAVSTQEFGSKTPRPAQTKQWINIYNSSGELFNAVGRWGKEAAASKNIYMGTDHTDFTGMYKKYAETDVLRVLRGRIRADDIFLAAAKTGLWRQLVFVNSNTIERNDGAIMAVGLPDGQQIGRTTLHEGRFQGWMDRHDGIFVGDANGDSVDDLFLVDADGSQNVVQIIEISSGNLLAVIPRSDTRFNDWMDESDRMCIGDVNGDGRQDLILVNSSGRGGAIQVIDAMTGKSLSQIPHDGTRFKGWLDSTDHVFVGDVNKDRRQDLVLVNRDGEDGAIQIVDLLSGRSLGVIKHERNRFGDWMDPSDTSFIADVNGDGTQDLIFVNASGVGGAVVAIDLISGKNIATVPYEKTRFNGWMDLTDQEFVGDVNGDGRQDLILLNTDYTGGAVLAVDIISGKTLSSIKHENDRFKGWMDSSDQSLVGDANQDGREDLILVNTYLRDGAIDVIDIMSGKSIGKIMHGGSRFNGWLDQ